MTQSQAIRLVCRAIVLYLLFWIISDITWLPREILAVEHAWVSAPALKSGGYYLREQILYLAANVLHIALWSVLAISFYQGGPRIERWFGAGDHVESAERQTTVD